MFTTNDHILQIFGQNLAFRVWLVGFRLISKNDSSTHLEDMWRFDKGANMLCMDRHSYIITMVTRTFGDVNTLINVYNMLHCCIQWVFCLRSIAALIFCQGTLLLSYISKGHCNLQPLPRFSWNFFCIVCLFVCLFIFSFSWVSCVS